MKILIVDDDELILKSITHTLNQENYEVEVADDVSKALNVLENQKIDLIIIDIMLPNISGLGLLSMLKNFYFDRIPVILISSLDKGDVVTNSLGLGASYFLTKPLDMEELIRCIKEAIEKQPG